MLISMDLLQEFPVLLTLVLRVAMMELQMKVGEFHKELEDLHGQVRMVLVGKDSMVQPVGVDLEILMVLVLMNL